ncbi:MAG: site-specific integrase, partial [Burkholderiales bacterium]|nr:site-specific integrase [Burkholderiales bacterium]
MARSQRDSKLETRTARLKLKVGQRYFTKIGEGLALGFRRTGEGYGNWQARMMLASGRYGFRALGRADDFMEANGETVLSFFQAQQKAREAATAIVAGEEPEPALPVTVADATTRYLAWYAENRKALRETTATIAAHILPTFDERALASLTTAELKAWHQKLAVKSARVRTGIGAKQRYRAKPENDNQKRARKSTANRILTVLKAILNKAFEDELAASDTAWRRVRPFENADEPVTRFLTEAECKRLINASRADLRALVKGALFTGARYSELTGLTVAHVNVDT